MKYSFDVPDMSCGHCKARIENALKTWGKASHWQVDLGGKKVTVDSAENPDLIVRVIEDVGYTPKQA